MHLKAEEEEESGLLGEETEPLNRVQGPRGNLTLSETQPSLWSDNHNISLRVGNAFLEESPHFMT